jgi:hypothetical protein
VAAMDIIGDSVGSGNEVGLVELVFSDRLQLDNKKHPKLNKHLKANTLCVYNSETTPSNNLECKAVEKTWYKILAIR